MIGESHSKVQARHLKRNAYLYVPQSTLRQVFENTESTQRQYDLRHRAIALGWNLDQVVVIDADLGQSGASAGTRQGFQHLVTEVSPGSRWATRASPRPTSRRPMASSMPSIR